MSFGVGYFDGLLLAAGCALLCALFALVALLAWYTHAEVVKVSSALLALANLLATLTAVAVLDSPQLHKLVLGLRLQLFGDRIDWVDALLIPWSGLSLFAFLRLRRHFRSSAH